MSTLHDIRRRNLTYLIETRKIPPEEIAESVGSNMIYLRQCLQGKHAKIGTRLATRIEEGLGLEDSWLSRDHSGETGDPLSTSDRLVQAKRLISPMGKDDLTKVLVHTAGLLGEKIK